MPMPANVQQHPPAGVSLPRQLALAEFTVSLPAIVPAPFEGTGSSAPQLHGASPQQLHELQQQQEEEEQAQAQLLQEQQQRRRWRQGLQSRPPVHSLDLDLAVHVLQEEEEQLAVEVLPEASDSEAAAAEAQEKKGSKGKQGSWTLHITV